MLPMPAVGTEGFDIAVSEMRLPCLQVQERFDVDIKPLPEKIDAATYMNAA